MDSVMLPATILLYITGAGYVVGILVNGIRTAIVLPAIVSFLGACVLGFIFVVLFAVANGVTMTGPLWAASVIAGVMVGGASAGANAVHNRVQSTDAPVPPVNVVVHGPTSRENIDRAIERARSSQSSRPTDTAV